MSSAKKNPRKGLPELVGKIIRPLPLFPLEKIFKLILKKIIAKNPNVFKRMGEYAGDKFLIKITDLPFVVVIDTSPKAPNIYVRRDADNLEIAATVTAPILSHVKMLTGELDGDALFFAREIRISGSTESVLALRNAVDSMDLDIKQFIKDKITKYYERIN